MNKIKYITLLLPFILTACPNPQSSQSNNTSGINSTLKNGSIYITVKDGISGQNVKGASAKITLTDNTVISKTTDNDGRAVFENLNEGTNYNVEVSSQGYIDNSISTVNSNTVISKNSPSIMEIKLYKSTGSFSGTVLSNDGTSVPNAVIQVGNDFSLSDESGNFKVSVSNLSQQKITISKIGFNNFDYGSFDFSLNAKDKSSQVIKLVPQNKQISVIFDSSKSPFGVQNLDIYKDFVSYLNESGFKTSYENILQKNDLESVDILVIVSPSISYSDSEIDKIKNFVRKGKKLIILGEWGGYSNFNSEYVNKLVIDSNLRINPNIVKNSISTSTSDDSDDILCTNFNIHPITKNISSINLYSSASLDIVNGGVSKINNDLTKILAFSASTSFTIQDFSQSPSGLIAASTLGLGKIILSGDSSLFMSIDSNKNNILNINEKDNKNLIKNIFSW